MDFLGRSSYLRVLSDESNYRFFISFISLNCISDDSDCSSKHLANILIISGNGNGI